MDLTSSQRQILTALVNRYRASDGPVPATTLAEDVDRYPGRVRDQMGTLTSLGLAEGVRGRGGGYEPTPAAYDLLDRDQHDESESLTLAHGATRITATVERIDFPNVHDPEGCHAHLTFRQPVGQVAVGDPVVVGPTPGSRLAVAGEVEATFADRNELYVAVTHLRAPLEADAETE